MSDHGLKDERSFTPLFLRNCTVLELVKLQHEMRWFPEDRPYVDQVMAELKRRDVGPPVVPPRETHTEE